MNPEDLLLAATDRWHPVASAQDVPYRHVYHGQLLGQELAIWRADDDNINVWENRCLHRGARLSIAQNDGRELKCRYHGWRYANRTAACTYIPAHPLDAPARTVTNRTYPVRVAGGLVWSTIGEPLEEPPAPEPGMVLRPLPIRCAADDVVGLLRAAPPTADGSGSAPTRTPSPFSVEVDGVGTFFVQPTDAGRSILRGVLVTDLAPRSVRARLELLKHFDRALGEVRDRAEEMAEQRPAPASLPPQYEKAPVELADLPRAGDYRELPTRVRVTRAWDTADGIRAMELSPVDGTLPSGQPGSHLDVALPGGLVRQYSMVNAPGETDRYVIGVKRTVDSAGGSVAAHDHLREGDVLAVSLPRNNFPLRRDRRRTCLIAGGIGITPLLAMAQALKHQHLEYELHYFVSADADVAFRDRLEQLADVHIVTGSTAEGTVEELHRILCAARGDGHQVYLCGPPPMIDSARQVADDVGWPKDEVHVEYFRNDQEIDDTSRFDVVLARSVMTLTVEPGTTILQTLRQAGVFVPSSCEQGACGTCLVPVIDGVPDHQDVYLTDDEKKAGTSVMTCVSRASTPTLTLDL